MTPTNHSYSYYAQRRAQDAAAQAGQLVVAVESGAHLWGPTLEFIDMAIASLKEAKALHAARIAEQEKAA